jgi:shikimate kinase
MPVTTDKVYLVGFMGAGKSTVAQRLAKRLGWRAEDLDEWIEEREGRPVAQIFSQEGEAYFRQVERSALRELVPQRHVVVATGGGTFADASNRAVIASDGASVWLDVSFDTAVSRLPSDGVRPLARDPATLLALWNDRQPAYALAQQRVDAEVPLDDIVGEILDRLKDE